MFLFLIFNSIILFIGKFLIVVPRREKKLTKKIIKIYNEW